MSARPDSLRVGFFTGPWDSGHVAQDGAIYSFRDIEVAVRRLCRGDRRMEPVPLDLSSILSPARLARALGRLDVAVANCGPLGAFLLSVRARQRLALRIVRTVHTLGWVGYAFQEFVARELACPGDVCLHQTDYALRVWRGCRGDASDRRYSPLLDYGPMPAMTPCAGRGAVGGYFSRVSRDKGFGRLPELVARLRAAGWPVTGLVVSGAVADGELMGAVRTELEASGIRFCYRGALSYGAAMAEMDRVDVVLFPSTSSIESSGRVVIEACQRGKPVIASDYCAAHDMLAPAHRVPLRPGGIASGRSDAPFEIAALDVAGWTPPPPPAGDGMRPVRPDFDPVAGPLGAFVAGGPVGRPPGHEGAGADRGVRMSFDWNPHEHRSAADWCDVVHRRLIETVRGREDLLDLGGAMKRSLLAADFNPAVSFRC